MVATRILIVDDDPKILSLMRRGLAFAGYTVDLAPDGEQALAMAREHPPALVVLDVMLPGMDGLEVCRRLRAGEPNLPVLMLTGLTSSWRAFEPCSDGHGRSKPMCSASPISRSTRAPARCCAAHARSI